MYKSYAELGEQKPKNLDLYDVLELQNDTHAKQIISQNDLVCIAGSAQWCAPCKKSAPDYAVMAHELKSKAMMVKYDYDKMEDGYKSMINGVPVYHFYVRGVHRKELDITGANLVKVRETIEKLHQEIEISRVQKLQGPQHLRNTIRNSRNGLPDTVNIPSPAQNYHSTGPTYHSYNS